MFSALKPVLEQLSTNVKKAPGWVPLSVLCYAAFHLLSQNLDGIGLSTATTAKVKAALAEHKELLVVAATFLLYILGDAIDKYLWKRLEPSGVNAARSKAEEALGVKQGLYRVSKALAEVAEKYDGSWIQVKNESAKMFRSLIIPSAVAGIVLIVNDQLAWGVAGLLGVGLFLLTYIHLKAAHICDLYRLAADTLTKNKEDYVTHDLQGRVRLFLWKGQLASSAELPSVLPFGFGPAEPGEAIVYGAQRPGAGSDDRVAWPTINEWITFVRQKGIRRVCCLLTARQLRVYDVDLLEAYREAFGASNVCHAPIEDYHLCDHRTFAETILPFLKESSESRMPVVVHCAGGLGRTGQILAAWLVQGRDRTVDEALRIVCLPDRNPWEAVKNNYATEQELRCVLKGNAH